MKFCAFLLVAFFVVGSSQQRTTKAPPTTTSTTPAYDLSGRQQMPPCTGNLCPPGPLPPCQGFGCPVTTQPPLRQTTVNKAIVGFNLGNDASGIRGFLELNQAYPTYAVSITGTLYGLMPNKRHAIIVHEAGDIREGCTSSKLHYNPYRQSHGGVSDKFRHTGDLGNIQADGYGKAVVNINDGAISLNGANSIIGRMLVIHEKEDDFGRGGNTESTISGNVGMYMSCGIVGIADFSNTDAFQEAADVEEINVRTVSNILRTDCENGYRRSLTGDCVRIGRNVGVG